MAQRWFVGACDFGVLKRRSIVQTLTAEKAMASVQKSAEKTRNDETATIGTMSLGDVIRQGDVYLIAIAELPEKRTLTENRQLAPGTSQGSRHVILGECEVFEADPAQTMALVGTACKGLDLKPELMGPVVRTLAAVELDHPEHGNKVLPANECFAVVYQRAFADTVRRQLD
jgi:hypothetical protein